MEKRIALVACNGGCRNDSCGYGCIEDGAVFQTSAFTAALFCIEYDFFRFHGFIVQTQNIFHSFCQLTDV